MDQCSWYGLWTGTEGMGCGPAQHVSTVDQYRTFHANPSPHDSCCTQLCVDSFIIIILVTWASKPKSCRLYVSSLQIDYYPHWNGTDHVNKISRTEQVWPWLIGIMMGEGVEVWDRRREGKVWREGRREGKVWREGRREGKVWREGRREGKVWREGRREGKVWREGRREGKVWREGRREGKVWREGRREGKVWREGRREGKVWREGRREGKVWREGRREGKVWREGRREGKVWRGKEVLEDTSQVLCICTLW